MHIDGKKKFDKRGVDRKIREGSISQRQYEDYLASLPDVSDKVYDPANEARKRRKAKKVRP